MGTRDRRADRGTRAGLRIATTIGNELRESRLDAGLSQRRIAELLGLSHTQIYRVERGSADRVSLLDVARHAAVLGLNLSVKLYPEGPPVRDAAHVALIERLKAKLGPRMLLRTEVPLPLQGDRRAWDAVIYGVGAPVGIEAETRLRDIQALARRVSLKQRDCGFDCVLLVVADTRGNRRLIREMSSVLEVQFPLPSRPVLAALGAGMRPRSSGIAVL
jgi:transcriptional regulator with XRE-family HTH domain